MELKNSITTQFARIDNEIRAAQNEISMNIAFSEYQTVSVKNCDSIEQTYSDKVRPKFLEQIDFRM